MLSRVPVYPLFLVKEQILQFLLVGGMGIAIMLCYILIVRDAYLVKQQMYGDAPFSSEGASLITQLMSLYVVLYSVLIPAPFVFLCISAFHVQLSGRNGGQYPALFIGSIVLIVGVCRGVLSVVISRLVKQ